MNIEMMILDCMYFFLVGKIYNACWMPKRKKSICDEDDDDDNDLIISFFM